ncbi:MAG: IS200/IS605 family accessory protein TnpB-related protein [Cyanobacteria bacterium P01_A01_bin.83]
MTLTYVKGLPAPINELNAIGETTLGMFLHDYSVVFHAASCETVNHLLNAEKFNKSAWNTYLQKTYGINKRHANGVIASSKGRVSSAIECRKEHLYVLKRKLTSAKKWLKSANKKLNSCAKFYSKKNWINSKTSSLLPLSCSLKYRNTNYQHQKFQVHHKQRKIYQLEGQIEHLKQARVHVKVPQWDCFVVGSKDETFGNQVCQWDGEWLKFRVPYCLEKKYGKIITTKLGNFNRKINRIPEIGAKSWHFYRFEGKWKAALQFTPEPIKRYSSHIRYGCIGIDINPGSIDWARCDWDGNLKGHGKLVLQQGLPKGKMKAQLVEVSLKLADLAIKHKCPIVVEELDFSSKKAQLKEKSTKMARMLSFWAYAEFFKQLNSILANRGIELKTVNPAYTSLIGLIKYLRQYGISSGVAAAIVIARRGIRLSEKLPDSITAYLDVKPGKHVWSQWSQLNKLIKTCTKIRNRHSYYGISNWGFLAKEQ